ncbi:hypothetical protein MKOR_14720 [Mycolicibacillus koreensis]|jgi:hypothetical protein|nr:hypothetical protein MKOR_14720 [Mycolicibacillus koreensis]
MVKAFREPVSEADVDCVDGASAGRGFWRPLRAPAGTKQCPLMADKPRPRAGPGAFRILPRLPHRRPLSRDN